MEKAILSFPDFLEEAKRTSESFSPPKWDVNKVVLLGMGGSALGGDILDSVMKKQSSYPFLVIRGEEIPRWVDEKTAVLAVSYSGNTHETLACAQAALAASQGKVIAITTGGKLKELALAEKFPIFEIPGGLMPRAALPYTCVPPLVFLAKMGILPDQTQPLQESIEILKKIRKEMTENSSADKNPFRKLARELKEKIPMIYAAVPEFLPAATRWKCQLNENGKHPAAADFFPEASHNGIVGFTNPLAIHKFLSVIFLRDSEETPLTKIRVEFAKQRADACGCTTHSLVSRGESLPAKLLSLCYYADFASLYLAESQGIDPSPVAVIDELKRRLAGTKNGGS